MLGAAALREAAGESTPLPSTRPSRARGPTRQYYLRSSPLDPRSSCALKYAARGQALAAGHPTRVVSAPSGRRNLHFSLGPLLLHLRGPLITVSSRFSPSFWSFVLIFHGPRACVLSVLQLPAINCVSRCDGPSHTSLSLRPFRSRVGLHPRRALRAFAVRLRLSEWPPCAARQLLSSGSVASGGLLPLWS